MKRSKNGGIYYLDDGGTAKSNDRRNRRRRRNIVEVIKYPIGFGILLVFLLRGSAVKESINKQRVKANIAINSMVRNRNRANAGKNHNVNNQMMDDDNNNAEAEAANQHAEKYRWTRDSILPPVTGREEWVEKFVQKAGRREPPQRGDFKVAYGKKHLQWEKHAKTVTDQPPHVDFTKYLYKYPEIIPDPPRNKAYPPMETLGGLLKRWPQNEFEEPPSPIVERLQHFDFTDLEQLDMAKRYRDLEFPFKLTNVPELIAANAKWTDEYLTFHFDRNRRNKGAGGLRDGGDTTNAKMEHAYGHIPPSDGHCQVSPDSFFAFFTPRNWNVRTMGEVPTKDTDFTYAKWAKHARYADSVGLESTEPHYYWQSGASPNERTGREAQKTMISVDLPSFSDPNPNFISFNPEEAKGIQCRFGERGVTAATHYDGGRNMIGMISGAKRYILAPPLECPKLGIVTEKKHPTFRHSLLNFDHINILDSKESKTMPQSEREWLELSRNSMAIDTVLKAGEILYIPSHWFHYIVSLQKSAQCNVRSGREYNGSPEWGTSEDVLNCVGDEDLPVSLPCDQTDSYTLGSGHCTSNCVVTSAPSPGPTGTLSGQCRQENDDSKFFFKIKNGEVLTKSCRWLQLRKRKGQKNPSKLGKVVNLCNSNSKNGNLDPAGVVCMEMCEYCKYFFKNTNNLGIEINKTCAWLSNPKRDKKRDAICNSSTPAESTTTGYKSAEETCFEACQSCPPS